MANDRANGAPADGAVDDIALFFKESSDCWVSHAVYTDPEYQLAEVDPSWQGAAFLEKMLAQGEGRYYVTNLSVLKDPGTVTTEREKTVPASRSGSVAEPLQDGDLVVIPWDEPTAAFRVPSSVYENPNKCAPISGLNGSDVKFMANVEGVILANIPKGDPQGCTCYVLNLRSLRQPPASVKTKTPRSSGVEPKGKATKRPPAKKTR